MGFLKDALFFEVFQFLLKRPQCKAMLSSLNHPQGGQAQVRDAWKKLQAEGKDEGMTKAKGLKVVLAERPDLFMFEPTETGHPFVVLAPAAQAADRLVLPPQGSLPDAPPMTMAPAAPAQRQQQQQDPASAMISRAEEQLWAEAGAGLPEDMGELEAALLGDVSPEEAAALLKQAQLELGGMAGKRAAEDDAGAARTAKKKKTAAAAAPVDPNLNARGQFRDLIWTPYLLAAKAREEAGENEMKQALIEALASYNGETVALSQLGFDFKVAKLRKNAKEKLLDQVKRYDDTFEIVPDSVKGGYNIRFQLGFDMQAAMAGSSAALLPRRIEDPRNLKERMQSLRIEVVYALHRRGGKSTVAELGQEPPVQRRKQSIGQAKKLQDFVQLFPLNFTCTPDPTGTMTVELGDVSVLDESMIDIHIQKTTQEAATRGPRPWERGGKGGKGGHSQGAPPTSHQLMQQAQQQAAYGFMPTGMAVPGMAMGFGAAPPQVHTAAVTQQLMSTAFGAAFGQPIPQYHQQGYAPPPPPQGGYQAPPPAYGGVQPAYGVPPPPPRFG